MSLTLNDKSTGLDKTNLFHWSNLVVARKVQRVLSSTVQFCVFSRGLTAHEHEADCEYFLCLRVGRDVAEAHGRQAGYREIDRRYVAGLEGAAECRSLMV